MFLKSIFADMQAQAGIDIFEEYFSQMIPFRNDDRIFFFQLSQVGECRTKHRVGRNIREATCLVKFFQVRLD